MASKKSTKPKNRGKRSAAKSASKKSTKKPPKKAARKTAKKAAGRKAAPKPPAGKPVRKPAGKPAEKPSRKTGGKAATKDPILNMILARLDEDQAANTIQIDLRGKSTIADTMVVTSGRSNRHVSAIADHVIESLHKNGVSRLRVEGRPNCDWVLIDAGDVVLHIFRPEVRAFYNLEKMWSRSPAQN